MDVELQRLNDSNDRRKKKNHDQQTAQMELKIQQRTNSSYTRADKDYMKASIPETIISSNSSIHEVSLQDINTCIKTVRLDQLSIAESQTKTRLELELITEQKTHSPTLPDNSTLSNSNSRRIQTKKRRNVSDNQSKYRNQVWSQIEKEVDPQINNQRELAAMYCALLRFGQQLQEKKIQSIHLRTDNTTTSFNTNRKNFFRTFSYLTDQTLQQAENLQIQLKATFIPGIENRTIDSLYRLNGVGDYHFRKRIAELVFKTMPFILTIDLLVNKKKLTKWYCTISFYHPDIARDVFSISWKAEQPVIHHPIPLIGHCLQRMKQEKSYCNNDNPKLGRIILDASDSINDNKAKQYRVVKSNSLKWPNCDKMRIGSTSRRASGDFSFRQEQGRRGEVLYRYAMKSIGASDIAIKN
ncbi:MAG: hypothetical protein EZS28_003720 [Streblomastix strix]|uniref:Uncharacterized protein n=1 Tax=Streblomastix strix TaxID=222440 RepID=A0A5J4X0J3_9EUKA|nr:MAG: hypothetical protein EZS28_003720 [Streblomastix strix]